MNSGMGNERGDRLTPIGAEVMESESQNESPSLSASSGVDVPYAYILCHVLHLSCSFG